MQPSEEDILATQKLVVCFRRQELENLMDFAGLGKLGNEHELKARAMYFVRTEFFYAALRVHELYRNLPILYKFPVHAGIKMTELPFYPTLEVLVQPISLVPSICPVQDCTIHFHFTPEQGIKIATSLNMAPGIKNDYGVQVHLRFCLMDSSRVQNDCLPQSMNVVVNGIPINMPFQSCPLNITACVKLNPNYPNIINMRYIRFVDQHLYSAGLYLVKKANATDLLANLLHSSVRCSDITRVIVQEKLNETAESDVQVTSLCIPLICPLGKTRIEIPCRSENCEHLQCFDALKFLQMNERIPTWICPVCSKPAGFEHLFIDDYFKEILASLPSAEDQVQVCSDGTWSSLIPRNTLAEANEQPQNEKESQGLEEFDLTASETDSEAIVEETEGL